MSTEEGAFRRLVAGEVRAWRARRAITQAELAGVLGISQPQVSARLNGHLPFSLDELQVLGDYFGISPMEFFPRQRSRRTVGSQLSLELSGPEDEEDTQDDYEITA